LAIPGVPFEVSKNTVKLFFLGQNEGEFLGFF